MRQGLNQYPPMAGVPALRDAVAAKIESLYGHRYDPASEITITAGATQAILSAILAVVHPGDEVIVPRPVLRQLRAEHRARGRCRRPRPADGRHFSGRISSASRRA
jgi:methionine aminotransferase